MPLAPWPYLKAGDRVRVEHGPMRGMEGALLRTKDAVRLVISVELLQRSIAVQVDRDAVVPHRRRKQAVMIRAPCMVICLGAGVPFGHLSAQARPAVRFDRHRGESAAAARSARAIC